MRKRITESVSVNEMKTMYDNGMSCEDIANAIGCGAATIYRYLSGYTKRGRRGGICSKSIQINGSGENSSIKTETIEEKNNRNACLVVDGRTVSLSGTVGAYEVCAKEKIVYCTIDDCELKLAFDAVSTLVEELKAIGRNLSSLNQGCEMW